MGPFSWPSRRVHGHAPGKTGVVGCEPRPPQRLLVVAGRAVPVRAPARFRVADIAAAETCLGQGRDNQRRLRTPRKRKRAGLACSGRPGRWAGRCPKAGWATFIHGPTAAAGRLYHRGQSPGTNAEPANTSPPGTTRGFYLTSWAHRTGLASLNRSRCRKALQAARGRPVLAQPPGQSPEQRWPSLAPGERALGWGASAGEGAVIWVHCTTGQQGVNGVVSHFFPGWPCHTPQVTFTPAGASSR